MSFEEVAPEASEMAERMRAILTFRPWLVAEMVEEGVIGYAYAAEHSPRVAYRWSVNVSAYVEPAWHGRGVGKRLYAELLEMLGVQGFVNVFAGVTLPNPASEALHASIGMELVGVYRRAGFKLGRWHDVAWYGLRLSEPEGDPPEPVWQWEMRPGSLSRR
ncbi:MAG TPA: GNAT family N-acetyltransferase [Candidatus Limnocylindria bacterium]|nr:GNAT family N-acetyltransferase [Candidatus Limnocylindria bacterium]